MIPIYPSGVQRYDEEVFFVGGVEMPLWEQIKHHLAGHVTTYIVTLATGLVLLSSWDGSGGMQRATFRLRFFSS